MKTTLKSTAAAFGVPLPRRGDITGSALSGNYFLIAFCGAVWRRKRSVESIRMFPRRGKQSDISAATEFARSLAARLSMPVTVEHGRMMFAVGADGSVSRVKRTKLKSMIP